MATGARVRRKKDMEVAVLEALSRVLQRVTAPELSEFCKRIYTEEKVDIREGVSASGICQFDKGLLVKTSEGDEIETDIVIIGIGVVPNVELAVGAGRAVGDGIEVNEYCQTSDTDVYAAGDVTWHYNPIYKSHVRLESVPNATEQAKVVANHINGNGAPYRSLPWFWSDQFDLKLQIAGLSTGYDNLVIHGSVEEGRSVAVFYFKGDTFLAVDAVNAPRSFV